MLAKEEIDKRLAQLNQDFVIANKEKDFENTLELQKVKNLNDIKKLDIVFGQNKELAKFQNVLQEESNRNKEAFQAAQNALERASREKLQLSDQNFKKLMQEEMQRFTGDQAYIDRAIKEYQFKINAELQKKGLDIKQETLSLAEATQTFDEFYKKEKLRIDELALETVQIGSKAKTAQLKYINNEERLKQYANGTLEDKNLYEAAILDYLNPANAEKVWDAELATYVKSAQPELTDKVYKSIKEGDPAFYERITRNLEQDPLGEQPRTDTGADTTVEPDASAESRAGVRMLQTDADAPKNLAEATTEIVLPDGRINLDSPAWQLTKPNRFRENIPYKKVIGLSRLYPGLKKAITEGRSELSGVAPPQDILDFSEAQKTLDAFANDLLQFTTNKSDDRVLKFVQELIEKETANLRPGGVFFKTDADAASTLKAIRDGLAQGLQNEVTKVPEYGVRTDAGKKLKPAQITAAREKIEEMKILLNEVLAFEKAFGFTPPQKGVGSDSSVDQSTESAKEQIQRMLGLTE